MRKALGIILVLVLAALVIGCSHEKMTEPTADSAGVSGWIPPSEVVDPEVAAGEIIAVSGWDLDPDVAIPDRARNIDNKSLGFISDFTRDELAGDVAHYSFRMRVGWGPYDYIKIHRVVKEHCANRPVRTAHSIFLQHGDAVGFVKFLFGSAAPSVPDDHAAAIFLAQNDVDVWGIDQNWVLLPEDISDFGFLQDWGMDNQIGNLRKALGVARFTRLFTGNGFSKMHLLGYSSGGWSGFAYLNDEAARPRWQRHVKGFVNADAFFKCGPDNPVGQQINCEDVAFFNDERANGVYEWYVGFKEVGQFALDDPDGASPIFEGFTNKQVALYFGGAGWKDYPLNEWWHYWGAEFDGDPEDPNSLPTGFRFLPDEWAFEFMTTAVPWQSNNFLLDYAAIGCDEEDVPWDDNLGDITVPVLNLGGAGGLAPSAAYTLGLLGSTDVQDVIVQLLPESQKFEDFAHIDMWTATDAPQLVWAPLLDWIVGHRGPTDEYPHTAVASQ